MGGKRRKTHEEFLRDLNRIHPERDWDVVGTYEHNMVDILLRDKYGDCLIKPNYLLQGSKPSIKTAINKTEYTINRFKEVWGNRYDYSEFEYNGVRTKSTIICKLHGRFLQDAAMHLSMRCGCMKCSNENLSLKNRSNTEEFIKKAVIKYKNRFTFDFVDYKSATENVIITCPKHGNFEQTPNRFLNGQICLKCSYKENPSNFHLLKKKRNNSVFYIIECYNEKERFLKMGVTTRNVKIRFKDAYDMPYKYNVLREFRYANIDAPFAIETELLKLTKPSKYVPNIKFSGHTELRDISIKEALLGLFDVCVDNLHYIAFVNFTEAHEGIFDESFLNSGVYSKLEIESVMKGYDVHTKLN